MPDTSAIPLRRAQNRAVEGLRPSQGKTHSNEAPSAVLPLGSVSMAPQTLPSPPAISPAGPRRLVRPRLPAGTVPGPYPARVSSLYPLQPHYRPASAAPTHRESSRSEAFYLQKQVHSQTLMVCVLEQGDQVEGYIEWFDRDAIKIRNGAGRTLIYKSSIKYLYKAGEKAALKP